MVALCGYKKIYNIFIGILDLDNLFVYNSGGRVSPLYNIYIFFLLIDVVYYLFP